jgi:hypothetical protein
MNRQQEMNQLVDSFWKKAFGIEAPFIDREDDDAGNDDVFAVPKQKQKPIPLRYEYNNLVTTEQFKTTKILNGFSGLNINPQVRNFIEALDSYRPAVLLGGAVRDLMYGKTVNDYDVYTYLTKDEALIILGKLKRQFGIQGLTQVVQSEQSADPCYDGPVNSVFEFYVAGVDEPIQLVCLNDHPLDYAGRYFSLDICRVGWSPFPGGDGRILFTDSFYKAKLGVIGIMNAGNLSNRYLNKIIEKYKLYSIEYKG